MKYHYDELKKLIELICVKVEMDERNAKILSNALLLNDFRGIRTHGIRCLPNYINRIRRGNLNPNPQMRFVNESIISALVDGDNGVGHLVATKCMEKAISLATEAGIGLVSTRNSNHFGAAAVFSMMALKNNFIGIALTNSAPRLAPTGGLTQSYGNNPISIAIPSNNIPIVMDMSLSVVANSNIIIAKNKGEKIPFGWAVTVEGEDTQDPSLAKILLPIAGYKGYALAVVVEALTGILSGASFGKNVGISNSLESDEGQNLGHLFIALDVNKFIHVEDYKKRIDVFIEDLKISKKAKNIDTIFLPGEKEFLAYQKNLEDGITIEKYVVEEIRQICRELCIQVSLS